MNISQKERRHKKKVWTKCFRISSHPLIIVCMLLWQLSLVVAGVSGGVVAAVDGWVVVQLPGQKVVYGGVGVAAGSAVEADAGGRQSILGALTDSAADECVDAFALEQIGQRAVAGSVAVKDM